MEPVINALSDEDVGRGLKLTMDYFKSGVYPDEGESPMALVFFSMLKGEVDNSQDAYSYAIAKAQQELDDTQQEENDYETINGGTLPYID